MYPIMNRSRLAFASSGFETRDRIRRWFIYVATVSLLFSGNAVWGKSASRSATVTLIATLESLSVSASPRGTFPLSTSNRIGQHLFPLTITTSWAVPSNLTTVRVIHDGVTLFAQKAGETNCVARRTDHVDVVLKDDIRTTTERQISEPVVILVQAL